jgi:ADP-ribosylglycohydrolase
MNSKERYFYFGETDIATTGEAAMFPLSSFLGMTPQAANRVGLHFKSRNGEATDDTVLCTLLGDVATDSKTFMSRMVDLLQSQKSFNMIIDGETSISAMPGNINSVGIATEA